ncbi:MAG TPA: ribonuclease D [Anaerolineae bacterium]|nr:ribonuclease D [Anaerolineae bacterium]
MTPPRLPAPKLIQEERRFQDLVQTLYSQPRLAVDTESNSLHAYKERVCLIQFSIPGNDFLVDPLSLPDIGQLDALFANPKIEKIFHGAEYDVMCLKRDFGFNFNNLFDTRVATRTLGRKRSGLRDVLAEEFAIQISKRYQRANWGKRPLPPALLDYARLDTHYLLPLRDHLVKALHTVGRWEEARETCEHLANVNAHENGFDPKGFWRISNTCKLTPKQIAILRELYLYRDAQARRLDRPPFKVLVDKTLLALAEASPKGLKALENMPGMTPGQIRRHGKGILAAIKRGSQAPIPRRPRHQPMDEIVRVRYETLRAWRKKVARERKVESDIILPREILFNIAQSAPHDSETLRKLMAPLDWRFKAYGQDILRVLRG